VQSFAPLETYFRALPQDSVLFRCAYDTTRESNVVRQGIFFCFPSKTGFRALEANPATNCAEKIDATGATKHDEMCNVYLYGYFESPPFTDISVFATSLNHSQTVGVTVLYDTLVIFSRGSRLWTSSSFGAEAIFQEPPLEEDTLFTLDKTTGRILSSTGRGLFRLPHAVRADPVDRNVVWVVDVGMHAVMKFHMVLKRVVQTAGIAMKPQKDTSGFCMPTDVAFSTDSVYAYVSDGYCNDRIMVLRRSDMSFVRTIEQSEMTLPHSLTLTSCMGRDVLLVCNREVGDVFFFDAASGDRIGVLRAWGSDWLPFGVALAPRGRVVVGLVHRLNNGKRDGRLWISEDFVMCRANKTSVSGTMKQIPNLKQPHMLESQNGMLFMAEAVDGARSGGIWAMNL